MDRHRKKRNLLNLLKFYSRLKKQTSIFDKLPLEPFRIKPPFHSNCRCAIKQVKIRKKHKHNLQVATTIPILRHKLEIIIVCVERGMVKAYVIPRKV